MSLMTVFVVMMVLMMVMMTATTMIMLMVVMMMVVVVTSVKQRLEQLLPLERHLLKYKNYHDPPIAALLQLLRFIPSHN